MDAATPDASPTRPAPAVGVAPESRSTSWTSISSFATSRATFTGSSHHRSSTSFGTAVGSVMLEDESQRRRRSCADQNRLPRKAVMRCSWVLRPFRQTSCWLREQLTDDAEDAIPFLGDRHDLCSRIAESFRAPAPL